MASIDATSQSRERDPLILTWNNVFNAITSFPHGRVVYGVPRGGSQVASIMAAMTWADPAMGWEITDDPRFATLFVDDIVDTGKTRAEFRKNYGDIPFVAVVDKTAATRESIRDKWIVFPWERRTAEHAAPTDNVRRLLQYIGEDPDRDGLRDTPDRVCRALREMTTGYSADPATILGRVFDVPCDELVVVKGIAFTSLCEHHLLPFVGTVDIGYMPGQVVGLSKLARLVDAYSRRLQVQERMTSQIATAILMHLDAKGVGVIVRGTHACMSCRGVRKAEAVMVTSAMLGVFRDNVAARAEFLALCNGGE